MRPNFTTILLIILSIMELANAIEIEETSLDLAEVLDSPTTLTYFWRMYTYYREASGWFYDYENHQHNRTHMIEWRNSTNYDES